MVPFFFFCPTPGNAGRAGLGKGREGKGRVGKGREGHRCAPQPFAMQPHSSCLKDQTELVSPGRQLGSLSHLPLVVALGCFDGGSARAISSEPSLYEHILPTQLQKMSSAAVMFFI